MLLSAALLASVFSGCDVAEVLLSDSTPTPEPTAIVIATPVPTPTPEPVITFTEPAALAEVPQTVPAGYSAVTDDTLPAGTSLYRFLQEDGSTAYRVYAGYQKLADGIETERFSGFYPSDETGAILGDAVDPSAEPFAVCTPQNVPDSLRVRSCYLPSNAIGHYRSDSPDVTGYVVYGSVGGNEAAFYPADEVGQMLPGSFPVAATVAVPSYTPADDPTAPDGSRRFVVYIGSQSVVCYKAEKGEWIPERTMACSTGRKAGLTPVGDFNLMRQYLYKKMGEVQGENVYSQYASRITGSYLFHSVPIGGKYRERPAYGIKQMFVKYYERLGSPASGGCVRLCCADAYWIYMNCETGTPVTVTTEAGPDAPEVPPLIYEEPYMDAKHEYGWDPTDPNPENPYHAVYEPEFVLDGEVIDKSHLDLSASKKIDDSAEETNTVEDSDD